MVLSNLISIVIVLAILGLCVWLVERFIPMAEPFKLAIRIVVVVTLLLWFLSWIGVWHGFGSGPLITR